MTVTPEDLAEAWHLVVANGAEPTRWRLPEALWIEVRKAADERASIDAGDPLPEEGDRMLLGCPVTVSPIAAEPLLYIRHDGGEASIAIHGTPAAAP